MGDDRNGRGRFTAEYSDEEILGAVRAHEPAATSEVAGEIGISRQAADYRLRRLRDEGRVSNKKIGASLVWFAPNAESGRESDETRRERGDDHTDVPGAETTDGSHETDDTDE